MVIIIILSIIGVILLIAGIVGIGFLFANSNNDISENNQYTTEEISETTTEDIDDVTTEVTEAVTEEDTTEVTEAVTEEDTTEVTEAVTEDKTEDTSTTSVDVDYSGTYTPDYEAERKGAPDSGYIDVPSEWGDWFEAGATWDNVSSHQQYSYGMTDIITHVTYNESDYPIDIEASLKNMEGPDSENTLETARFGNYEGYLLTEKFSDGITLRIFMFNDGEGHIQFLSVEGIDDKYADVYKLVFQNFALDK